MKMTDFMVPQAFVPALKSSERDEVIAELIDALVKAGKIQPDDAADIVEKLCERERQGSTGIGKGIAVPHVKHPSITEITGTIGRSIEGVNFNSLDKAPVYSVLLLLSPPNDPDKHLEAMEKVFSHLQRDMFRKFLRQAETTEQIVDLLKEAEESSK
ncbi:MAG: PTS sugar transporter subunit IIA [Sedimentisphaerales bacterium]|nr:PTS sugar transporter subunit IIA [Sedimentisphaerales bacterium]MBN2842496.1 PTS sugar transporter subunit IIA [Sedimentisphaerales bacterium]